MKRVGLTGGMGAGKTTVAKIFASFGCIVIDADQVARSVRKPGSAGHQQILARFQTDDRAELRRILATSPIAKKDLEAILHPLIGRESDRLIADAIAANPKAKALIYEATLLLEAGRAKDFDQIVVVTAPLADRINRVMVRDQISEKDAELIIQSQSSDDYRIPQAHHLIENLGALASLEIRVRKVLDQIISA
jgi:dephospho-CoA kinase